MRTVIVIPARLASQRFPAKPLALLRDAAGVAKPLVQRSWEAARAVPGVAEAVVATDADAIRRVAEGFGARVVMTSPDCENGTARCAEALATGDIRADLVVNLQGDAPLTPPWFVTALIDRMAADPGLAMATPVVRCDAETFAHFAADRRAGRVGATTAVFGAGGRALYFSKEILPHVDSARHPEGWRSVFHHVGLYAYRPKALAAYAALPPGPLERLEGLEQLRFLENGIPVACVEVDPRGRVFWEVNHPEDIDRVEAILQRVPA